MGYRRQPPGLIRCQDEIDAKRAATDWIHGVVDRLHVTGKPGVEITRSENTTVLWVKGEPRAIAVFVRDDLNFTIASMVEHPSYASGQQR